MRLQADQPPALISAFIWYRLIYFSFRAAGFLRTSGSRTKTRHEPTRDERVITRRPGTRNGSQNEQKLWTPK